MYIITQSFYRLMYDDIDVSKKIIYVVFTMYIGDDNVGFEWRILEGKLACAVGFLCNECGGGIAAHGEVEVNVEAVEEVVEVVRTAAAANARRRGGGRQRWRQWR